ncbi:MAG: RsbRD N-terminal domain-containing protein, partial [Gemmatimonadota bacterium]
MARVPFSDQLADRLAEVASDLARRWVERLQERLDERPDNVLPTERLLDDIPQLIRELAAFIRGDVESVSEGVLESVSDLSRLRRSQGFGITELLDEYRLLADLIQDEADRTAAALGEDGDPREVVRTMGRVRDGILHIGSLTARAYRRWDARAMRERGSSAASFCALFSHELHNSLGAAETAAHVVAELGDSAPERRERLLHLILRSLERGRTVAGQLSDFVAPGPLDAPMGPRLPVDMLLGEIIRQYTPE